MPCRVCGILHIYMYCILGTVLYRIRNVIIMTIFCITCVRAIYGPVCAENTCAKRKRV